MQPPNSVQQPWDFDPTVYERLLQEQAKGEKPFYLVDGGQKDREKVLTLYQKNPALGGLVIERVEVIFNKEMLEGFLSRLKELEEMGGSPAFQAKWIPSPERTKVHQALLALCRHPTGYSHAKLVPMFHGTTSGLVPSILKTNFANLAETDPGFFWKRTLLHL